MIVRKGILALMVLCLPQWISLTISVAIAFPVESPKSIQLDFKRYSSKHPYFKLMQSKNSLFQLDGEGLLFELPPGRKGPTVDGLVSQVNLRGDFEISLHFDQLTLLGDPAANGTGVAIWLALEPDPNTSERSGATMSRHWRTEGPRFVANKITFKKSGEKTAERYQSTFKAAPAQQTAGRLRLTRRGSTLTHWATQSDAGEFEPVLSWEIGTADVTTLRFQVVPGGLDKGVKVRLLDAEISAAGLFLKSGEPVGSGAPSVSQPLLGDLEGTTARAKTAPWIWILLGGAGLFAFFGALIGFLRLYRLAARPKASGS